MLLFMGVLLLELYLTDLLSEPLRNIISIMVSYERLINKLLLRSLNYNEQTSTSTMNVLCCVAVYNVSMFNYISFYIIEKNNAQCQLK